MVDRSHRPLALRSGDVVVLASDGIHTISHDAIARAVDTTSSPARMAEALLAAVEAAGDPHQDNTTVVVVRV